MNQNVKNIAISAITILSLHLLGFSAILFWVGGLLVFPAISVIIQAKYATGNLLTRLIIAISPWLLLCSIGLLWASQTSHEGQRDMNLSFFQMPLYSAMFGCFLIALWTLFNKIKARY
ncbi:hypothetical protein [Pseudoalteromonas rubra]|uniref:hypothetical protein n=1 Tax=Pseudoalteromonas rubra TaxID=43658 RepID=UPI0012FA2BDE|nr:hypothetical protein [Pseudoalteromonas rubra]